MFKPLRDDRSSPPFDEVLEQLEALMDTSDVTLLGKISSLANASALLAWYLGDINWVGFYLVQTESEEPQLVLGPFHGAPACVTIAKGKGVCGTAWEQASTQVVPDVLQFPGHIACDVESRSELVVPLVRDGSVFGVLDLDSPLTGRFDTDDQAGVEVLVAIYVDMSDWSD